MTKNVNRHTIKTNGFSLVETMVAVIILSLMVGAVIGGLKIFFQKEQWDATTDHKEKIETAIADYVNKYGALPCPARLSGVSLTDPQFGRKVNCLGAATPPGTFRVDGRAGKQILIGAVPARDLGLPVETMLDSWGNLFTYAVTEEMTSPGAYSLPTPDFIVSAYSENGTVEVDPDFIDDWSEEGNSAIRKGTNLYLISNTDNSGESESLMIVGYFDIEDEVQVPPGAVDINGIPIPMSAAIPFPDILAEGAGSCNAPANCIEAITIQSNVVDYTILLYDLAAIEVRELLPDGTTQSLSPEDPNNPGTVNPGHMSFAIISHGPSGLGAFNTQGAVTQACSVNDATFEAQNCDYNSAVAGDDFLIAGVPSGLPNSAVFTFSAGYSIGGDTASNEIYTDDIVTHSSAVESWPPHRLCDPGTGQMTGMQLKNIDGSWGICQDIGGDVGPIGPKGPTGPRGTQGPPGNVAMGDCGVGQVMKGFNAVGDPICVIGGPPASSIPDIEMTIVKHIKGPADPHPAILPSGFAIVNHQTYAECPATHELIACGGSREPDVIDNSSEEDGGYVGTIPWPMPNPRGCITGVDYNGGIRAVAIAYCMRLVY